MDCVGLQTALVGVRELLFVRRPNGEHAHVVQQVDALDGQLLVIRRLQTTDPRALEGFETSLGQVSYTVKTALERVRHLLQPTWGSSLSSRGGAEPSRPREYDDDSHGLLKQCVLLMSLLLDTLPT